MSAPLPPRPLHLVGPPWSVLSDENGLKCHQITRVQVPLGLPSGAASEASFYVPAPRLL